MKFIKSIQAPSQAAISDLWKFALVLAFLFVSLDIPFKPLTHGLDASWRYAVNLFFSTPDFHFGREIYFPMGPFYFLMTPLDIGNNLQIAVFFRLGMHIILGSLLTYYLWSTKDSLQVLLFMAALFGAFIVHHRYDFFVILTGVLAFGVALRESRYGWIGASLSAFLSVFLFLTKLNLGFMMTGMCTLGSLLLILIDRKRGLRMLAVYYGSAVAGLLFFALLMKESFIELIKWVLILPEFFKSYSITDGLPGPFEYVLIAILTAAVFLIITAAVARDKDENLIMALMFAAGLFLVWKNAFVRQDAGHLRHWYSFMLTATSCLIIFAKNRSQVLKWTLAFTLSFILSLPMIMRFNHFKVFTHLMFGGQTRLTLDYLSHFEQAKRLLAMQTQKNQWPTQLPPEWLAIMKQANSTVDIIPWELSYMASNPVKWAPNPLLQLYISRTPALDKMSAAHYGTDNEKAPDFVVVEWRSIQNYHTFWDAPITWRSILDNYTVADIRRRKDRPDLILLKKGRSAKRPFFDENVFGVVKEAKGNFGDWINVPVTNSLVFAEIHLSQKLRTKIMKTLYHIPPILVEVQYASGKTAKWRLSPINCASGIIMNAMPSNFEELAALLNHDPAHRADRIVRFRIDKIGKQYFRNGFPVRWRNSGYEVAFNGAE